MAALKKAGFKGAINFEIQTARLPGNLREKNAEFMTEIAKTLNLVPDNATNEEGVKALADAVRKLMTQVGIPLSIKEAGEVDKRSYIDPQVYEKSLEDLAYKAFDDQCTTANPRVPRIAELKNLYMLAYYGK